MRNFVIRILMVALLFSVVIYLIPDSTGTLAEETHAEKTKKSSVQPMPADVIFIEDIPYRKGNHYAWRLDLAMPKTKGVPKRPALVFVHGGGWRYGDKSSGYFRSGAIEFARKGFVCISVNYRLADDAPFPACVEDVKCAVRWLRAHADKYGIDPNRVGGYGNSAGAHLVCMLGLVAEKSGLEGDGDWQDQSSLLNAVCAAATPTDFLNWPGGYENKRTIRRLLDAPDTNLKQQAFKASPISYVHAKAPPFLLIHGTDDRLVDISQADRFVNALKKAGAKDINYHRYEKSGHSVFRTNQKETYPLMEKFFKRTLLDQKFEPTQSEP